MHFLACQVLELRPPWCKNWRRSSRPLPSGAGRHEGLADQSTNRCVSLRGRSFRGTHPSTDRDRGLGISAGSIVGQVRFVPPASGRASERRIVQSRVQALFVRAGLRDGSAPSRSSPNVVHVESAGARQQELRSARGAANGAGWRSDGCHSRSKEAGARRTRDDGPDPSCGSVAKSGENGGAGSSRRGHPPSRSDRLDPERLQASCQQGNRRAAVRSGRPGATTSCETQ